MKEMIVKLRKSAELSQQELARRLGISRPTLIAIEKGERDVTFTELKNISKIFDIPLEMLIDEEIGIKAKADSRGFTDKALKKFHNLILQCVKYGSDKDGKITKTKLAKLVSLCDFANYYYRLKPISGFAYRRLDQGPVAIEFFDILDNDESIYTENSKNGKAIMVSLAEEPDDTALDPEEMKLVKDVCGKWKKANTKEIVDFTHRQIPWAVCGKGEVIPYELINMESPENVY